MLETIEDLGEDDDGERLVDGKSKGDEPNSDSETSRGDPIEVPVEDDEETDRDEGGEGSKEDLEKVRKEGKGKDVLARS